MKYFIVIALFALYLSAPQSASAQKTIDDVIVEMIGDVSVTTMLEHLKIIEDAGGTRSRITFTAGKDSAAVYLKKVLDAMPGLTSVEYDTFYIPQAVAPFNTRPLVNVVATIEGSVYPDEYYVIGAHFDSIADRDGTATWNNGATWATIEAPGANDNGSGVVALLEMARIFADPKFDFTPERTIKHVFFGAEERGVTALNTRTGSHYGSIHFAEQARARNDKLIGMISTDMIGYNNNFDYTAFVKVDNDMATASEALAAKLVEANNLFTIGLLTNASYVDGKFTIASGRYSDHESFADEGFPAILVIENAAPWNSNNYYTANPYYHKQSDTWNRMNMGLVRKVAQMNIAAIGRFVGTVTSIDREPLDIAQDFTLEQNYPNPFNPTTTIRYTMQQSGQVSLRVYDVLGNEIATLVDQTQAAGTYTVRFDATSLARNLSSGMYLYRLETERTSLVRKMMLVK